jgi:NADH-quinone oxidoreductase subunit G
MGDIRAGRVQHVVALGGAAPRLDPEDATALGMLTTLVVVAAHEGPFAEAAQVVLPATSWAEHAGTYVNRKGLHQASHKALEPQGSSRPAWEHARTLARAMHLEPGWKKLKDVRAALAGSSAAATTKPDTTTASAE